MISYLEGTPLAIKEKFLILLVGGIGYKVFLTPESVARAQKKDSLSLWIHHVIREDTQDLFGFFSESELAFFELLITISGIGPKTALGILSSASIETIEEAVIQEDPGYLSKVGGIGKKNAEKIVLELKGKLVAHESIDGAPRAHSAINDVLEALLSLGYHERSIRDILKKIPKEVEGTEARIKYALKLLS